MYGDILTKNAIISFHVMQLKVERATAALRNKYVSMNLAAIRLGDTHTHIHTHGGQTGVVTPCHSVLFLLKPEANNSRR